jgi:hypothetical protein
MLPHLATLHPEKTADELVAMVEGAWKTMLKQDREVRDEEALDASQLTPACNSLL